ncbi:hypothetical protein ACFL52_02635 [Candidatus Margulisiibacteriota bacterium]
MKQHNDFIDEIASIEQGNKTSSKWNLPVNAQKPCLLKMLDFDIPEGSRNESFYILACDLINRQKKDPSQVEGILINKNYNQSLPLTNADIKAITKSASKLKHNQQTGDMVGRTYGCNNQHIQEYCIGRDNCDYYKSHFTGSKSIKAQGLHTLLNKGWLPWLTGGELKTYAGLCKLERIKGIKPGRVLIVAHRECAKTAGLSRPTIAEALKSLHFNGLINYKKGLQHKKYKTASEVRRTLPIPSYADVKKSACPVSNKTPLLKTSEKGGIRVS